MVAKNALVFEKLVKQAHNQTFENSDCVLYYISHDSVDSLSLTFIIISQLQPRSHS